MREIVFLSEANADQITSNSKLANMVKAYLRRYGVKFTWRINKHIQALEKLYRGNPDDIKMVVVGMPDSIYEGMSTGENTRIYVFTDKDIHIYGKGILSGSKGISIKLDTIHDVVVDEGIVWSKVTVTYKQTNNAHESALRIKRIHKNAAQEILDFLSSHTKGSFKINKVKEYSDKDNNRDENKMVSETVQYTSYDAPDSKRQSEQRADIRDRVDRPKPIRNTLEDHVRATGRTREEMDKLRRDWTANPELMKTQSLAIPYVRPQRGNKPTQGEAASGQQLGGSFGTRNMRRAVVSMSQEQ